MEPGGDREQLTRGEALFAAGRYEPARECFATFVRDFPEDARGWNNLGVVSEVLGATGEAEESFTRALAVDPDCFEAHLNLADLLENQERVSEAVDVLSRALHLSPGDWGLLRRLAGLLHLLGRRQEAREILEGSPAGRAMRKLIGSIWSSIRYWGLVDDLDPMERTEGAVAGALAAVDGLGADGPSFRLVAEDAETGELISLEGLKELLYYRTDESPKVEGRITGRIRALTPDQAEDWHYFITMLYRDIQAEGMCLGDFTHARRVFEQYPHLSRYDRQATFQFFRDNIGPCDCHIFRWSEMGVTSVREEEARKAAACPLNPSGRDTAKAPARAD